MPTRALATSTQLGHSVDVTKDRQFHMRVGAEDEARLAAIAKHHEMTAAQVVRMLIKREAELIAATSAKAATERSRATRRR